MQRAGGFSKFVLGLMIPICIWGLLASLLMFLIEVRSIFIEGGQWRLRQATLAFAIGIILIQRISRMLGKSVARGYAIALGAAITLFCAWFAHSYRLPTHPLIVFATSEILFLILWCVGHKLTAACWLDEPIMQTTAAETGIFARMKIREKLTRKDPGFEEREKEWQKKLPRNHPGRVILYFSFFAIPVFGLGIYLFDATEAAIRLRMGLFLFMYLWCGFSLLFLSSLSQLVTYFEKRKVSFPDQVGVPWLAIGFLVVTVVMVAAFFLPQPASIPGLYVRNRIVANYRGWESKYGVRERLGKGAMDKGGEPGQLQKGKLDRQSAKEILDKRYKGVDKLDDAYLSDIQRNTGVEPEYRNVLEGAAAANESFGKIFDVVIKVFFILLIPCTLVLVYILIASLRSGLSHAIGGWRLKRKKKKIGPVVKKAKKPRKESVIPLLERFRRFADPFRRGTSARDGDALVRYMWEAFLAFCADYGNPCTAEQTPFEFVRSNPPAIEGFEERAAYIAEKFTFSEYSGEKVSDSEMPGLKKFWRDLQAHASHVS